MLKILKAFYGSLDVTDRLNSMIVDNRLKAVGSNDIFGDPDVGKFKRLTITYEYNGEVKETFAYENFPLELPDDEFDKESNNVLVLTSCNRVKQVLFALTINSYIIKEKFSVVIADSSTPHLGPESGFKMHNSDDPYNLINTSNYCSDLSLFDQYIKLLPNVKDYKLIHVSPRMTKQVGDATLTALGMAQAALTGGYKVKKSPLAMKITGVCVMYYDLLSQLPELLKNKDALTFHRTNIGGNQRSTRIFACRPDVVVPLMMKFGWNRWVSETAGYFEDKFADMLNENIPDRINYMGTDEQGILVDGGTGIRPEDLRPKLLEHIIKSRIPTDNPLIREFIEGGIW